MRRAITLLAILFIATAHAHEGHDDLDLTHAVVCAPAGATAREAKALDFLLDEVEARTNIRWQVVATAPPATEAHPVITLQRGGDGVPPKAEAYAIRVDHDAYTITAHGHDERGVLFAAGRLLREMKLEPGSARIDAHFEVATAPETPLRGHQLGYRPKTNSYDAWTAEVWEQYIRDLIVFGTNAVELIPPRSDDAPTSPHFPVPQIEMMKIMSQICDDYGLDVWIWYPALDKDYTDPAVVDFALNEWHAVFNQLPRIDAIFVPGGDPGHTEPLVMMKLLEKQTANLHRTHPNATMWMSPQGFYKDWMDLFLNYMQTEQPKWMTGIVFGPQNRLRIEELRAALPAQYPIRHYPDITHTAMCQFPVPDWDLAFALTQTREPINPRPTQFTHIYQLFKRDTFGFITYSEGCNDDVNKMLWSNLGWDSAASLEDFLKQYARYFIGPRFENDFAEGLLALEQNWVGPLAKNRGVLDTLSGFQGMEKRMLDTDKRNWRFQQALYRAYYDAYLHERLNYELDLESQAMKALKKNRRGSLKAIEKAEAILQHADTDRVAPELRDRVFQLAEDLYQSIRMQLSVPKYQAINVERGANLDLIDYPLNDRPWLNIRFAEIRKLDDEKARRAALDEIVNWTNPGPGGYYDNFGDPEQQPHLVRKNDYSDPEFKTEPNMGRDWEHHFKRAWNAFVDTRYESDLHARYTSLDPSATYTVKIIYAGDNMQRKMRMHAEGTLIHDFLDKPTPPEPLTFEVPSSVTADGTLELTFSQEPGGRGGGRGCQVAEIWLIRKP